VIKRQATGGYILTHRPIDGDKSTLQVLVRVVTMPWISCCDSDGVDVDIVSAAHARLLRVVLSDLTEM